MTIQSLQLVNFRNYAELSLELTAPVTYVLGPNAQGKTNLLEALYVIGRGASFRTSAKADLLRHGTERAKIAATTDTNGLCDRLEVELSTDGRRQLTRNGKKVARPDAQWPHVILFAPEETLLFKVSPEMRRDYLDTLIEGMEPAFRSVRLNYFRVLKQRNRILSGAWEHPRAAVLAQLAPWTAQLTALGERLTQERARWIARIAEVLPDIHAQFAPHDGRPTLHYHPNITTAAQFADILSTRVDEEIARGTTVVGPQRDDVSVSLADEDLRHCGSQGQHRSVILSLKLTEVALAQQIHRRAPTLLLDDVASELDPVRGTAFFTMLTRCDCQIILTTTHEQGFVPQWTANAQKVVVSAGEIR